MTYFRKESKTSKNSAFAQDYGSLQKNVFYLLTKGDLAVFEIASILGRELHSINPRLNELMDQGLVMKTGRTTYNPDTEREVEVWTAKINNYPIKVKKKANKKNNIRDAIICLKHCKKTDDNIYLIDRAIQLLEA